MSISQNRFLVGLVVLISSTAFAQNGGTWTGYVRGWVNDTPGPAYGWVGNNYLAPPRRAAAPVVVNPGPYLLAQSAYAQQVYTQQLVLSQRQAAERESERLAAEREAVARLERERELVLEEQRLVEQQRLVAQQEMLVQQQKLQELAAQQLAAAQAAQAAAAQQVALVNAEREREEKEHEARRQAELAAKPREKGPDVYRWVDEDGVIHLSTRPPNSKR